jgi:hypothetical protein
MTKSSLLNFGTGEVISRRCKDHNLRKEAAHDGSRRKEAWKFDFESPPLESSGKYCTAAADAQRIGTRPLGLEYEVTELGRTSRNRSLPCIAMGLGFWGHPSSAAEPRPPSSAFNALAVTIRPGRGGAGSSRTEPDI